MSSFGLSFAYSSLVISNEENQRHNEIVKSFQESGLLVKGISETIKNETKEPKGGFRSILLGTLSATLLGNGLTGKEVIRADEVVIRAGQNF